jgi:hypothetical protein
MRSEGQNEPGTLNAYIVNGNEVQAGDRYGYKIVAVVHDLKDAEGKPVYWSAYRLWTTSSDAAVAANGDIISYETAALLFPTIAAVVPHYQT